MRMNGYGSHIGTIKNFINQQQSLFDKKKTEKKNGQKEVPADVERLKQILEDRKRATESTKNDRTAKKIARGQHVTAAERSKLYEESPDKFRKAVVANQMREATSKRLAQAKTKLEKSTIIAEGKSMALNISENGDQELGELYLEAVNKAEMDDLKGRKPRHTSSKNTEFGINLGGKGQSFDVKR